MVGLISMGTSIMPACIVIISILSKSGYSQSCGVSADLCGSRYAYCGVENDYCAQGCLAGSNDFRVADVVTDVFFGRIANQAAADCAGKGFYTRAAFLEAVKSYPQFAKVGSVDVAKREVAAFFAHATDATEYFCYIEAMHPPPSNCCDAKSNTAYPCVPGKDYRGRGPLQLTWNNNYGAAGRDIGFDGLNHPEIVATDPVVSFKTALWFWMKYCDDLIASGLGFGSTIPPIRGSCNTTDARAIGFYKNYCNQLGVAPGDKLACYLLPRMNF